MVEGGRMSDNKPPMTLYLQNEHPLHEEPWRDDDVTWCRDKIFRHDVGPYILKDWLKEELMKRAKKGMRGYASPEKYFSELGRAVIDILTEINAGKNEL